MSNSRVIVTVGRSGQRTVTSGGVPSDNSGCITESRKRPVKDRLGSGSQNISPMSYESTSSKRQRQEGGYNKSMYKDSVEDMTSASVHSCQVDLRHHLDQKNSFRSWQGMGHEIHSRIPGPVPTPRGPRVVLQRPSALPSRSVPPVGVILPPNVLPSISATPKPPLTMEKMDIQFFLKSLGLSKYLIIFQAEEVDMTVLRTMSDDDLKELGLPMGPRKKILLAMSSKK